MNFLTNNIFLSVFLALSNFVLNFLVFTYSYNKLATPFLNEEQRVENADYIMSVSLSMFAIVATITGVAIFFISRKKV